MLPVTLRHVLVLTLALGLPFAASISGQTPADLFFAARDGRTDVVRDLLRRGSDPNAVNRHQFDKTPLVVAAEGGHGAVIDALIAAGADVNRPTSTGWTALMAAACSGDLALVRALLARNASVTARVDNGYTALMNASACGLVGVAELLVAGGANVNAQTSAGLTALAFAVWEGHLDMTRWLMDRGADPGVRFNDGRTLLEVARDRRHTGVVEILERNRRDFRRAAK
jgi:ankyrin repeat protein